MMPASHGVPMQTARFCETRAARLLVRAPVALLHWWRSRVLHERAGYELSVRRGMHW